MVSDLFVPTGDSEPTNPDGKSPQTLYAELLVALQNAHENNDYVYLEEGTYELSEQIWVDANKLSGVKGIIGKGIDKTLLKFSKPQVADWDSENNLTDSRTSSAIVFDGVNERLLNNFKLKYTGEFYRKGDTYFGAASGIAITNGSNNTVRRVEVTGFNRAGVYLGGVGQNVVSENTQVYRGQLDVDAMQHHPRNNRVEDSYLHHNRVAGVVMNNQVSPRVFNNRAEYNGHPNDGGTGYGITAASGSINVDVVVDGNVVRYNYRKGIDSHDAYDFVVTNNTIYGNRFFGIAIEGRGYPQRYIYVKGNKIHQDPSFRLLLDDNHAAWTDHRNSDYYQFTGIRIENKSQPAQSWVNQPADARFVIEENIITGIEQDERKVHRAIEFRNHEQAQHVKLDTVIRNNQISGKSIGNLLFIQGERTATNGVGNFLVTGNTFTFDKIVDVPINIAQLHPDAIIGGAIDISGNTFNVGDNSGWINGISIEATKQPIFKFNDNEFTSKAVTHSFLYLGKTVDNSDPLRIEMMNNVFNAESGMSSFTTPPDGRGFGIVYDGSKAYPLSRLNWYNNRWGSKSGEVIPLAGTTNNATYADITSNAPDKAIVAGDTPATDVVTFSFDDVNTYGAYSDDGLATLTTRAAANATPPMFALSGEWSVGETNVSPKQPDTPVTPVTPTVTSEAMVFSFINETSDDSGSALIETRAAVNATPTDYTMVGTDEVTPIAPFVMPSEKSEDVVTFSFNNGKLGDDNRAVIETRAAANATPADYTLFGEQ